MLGQILCPSRRVQCVIPSSCYQLVTNGKEIMYVIKKSVNSALPIVATGKQTAGVLSTCQDHNPNCRPFMDLCKDKLYYMFLATYCPKSCGFCSSPTSNTTTTTPQPTSNVVKQPSEFSIFASSPAPLPSRRAVKYVLEGKKRPLRKWPAATTIPPSTTTTVISQSTTVTASKKSKKRKTLITTTTDLILTKSISTTPLPTTTISQSDSQEEDGVRTESFVQTTTPNDNSRVVKEDNVAEEVTQPESVEIANFLAIKNKSSSTSREEQQEKGEERSERQKKEVSSSTAVPSTTTTPINVLVEISSSIKTITLTSRENVIVPSDTYSNEKVTTRHSLTATPARVNVLAKPESIVEAEKPKKSSGALYCAEREPLLKDGKPVCPITHDYDAARNRCCGDQPITPGQQPVGGVQRDANNGNECSEALIVNGVPKCPATHPYDQARKLCCGSIPIKRADNNRVTRAPRVTKRTKTTRRNGTRTSNNNCVDKSAAGRPSDCPANKDKCDDALWKDLMTEQCPKTCNRCGQKVNNTSTAKLGKVNCADGTGKNGTSDCPANKDKCNDAVWKEFMRKECPLTCGTCTASAAAASSKEADATTKRPARDGRRTRTRTRTNRRTRRARAARQ
uniref:ShKT domain-containing protein n=1 Tax=Ditylenchus dipsaci TaxID=166011 RepID=A0A915E0N4_9BILA